MITIPHLEIGAGFFGDLMDSLKRLKEGNSVYLQGMIRMRDQEAKNCVEALGHSIVSVGNAREFNMRLCKAFYHAGMARACSLFSEGWQSDMVMTGNFIKDEQPKDT